MTMFPGKALTGLCMLAAVASTQVSAQADIDLADDDQRTAYSIGVRIGQNLMQDPVLTSLDHNAFFAGMREIFDGESRISDAEIDAVLQAFQENMVAEQEAALEGNLVAGQEFLSANAQAAGVVELPSGLQYLVLEAAPDSAPSPTPDSIVQVHYHGTFIDGSVFDSSIERGQPAQFPVTQVIAGWTEALQLMSVGDKWRLFIPPGLAYGASPPPAIPPNSTLIFEVELLAIQ